MDKKIPLDSVSASIVIFGTLVGITWRYRVTGTKAIDVFRDRAQGVIYSFWHSHILPLSFIFRGIGVKAVVSGSKDGDRAAAVAQRWRHGVIRGSSSSGGFQVLRTCVRELQRKQNLAIAPDGPRGPRQIVKPGVAKIALMANAPIFPLSAIPQKAWHLHSWDRFMVPYPFAAVELRIGEPILPERFLGCDDPVARLAGQLQRALTL
jgi:lysophospholipid acyltransferase (LPLAT)-like uncharacterized protein